MKDKLKKWTIDIIGEGYKKILLGVVVYLLSIAGTLKLKDMLQMPVPLWLVILIFLSILFGCAILFLIHSYISSNKPNYQFEDFPIGQYIWETKVYNYGYCDVERTPRCLEHDLKFLYTSSSRYCPEIDNKNCNNRIAESEHYKIYETAKSYIDKQVRNRK